MESSYLKRRKLPKNPKNPKNSKAGTYKDVYGVMDVPRVEDVLEALQTVLEDPSEITRGRMWAMTLVEELDIGTVERYVEEDKSLMPLLENHMHLENQMVKPLARDAIALTWDSIQKYVGDVERLRSLIVSESKNPKEMKKVLYSEEGTKWLNERVTEIYHFLYDLAFEEG